MILYNSFYTKGFGDELSVKSKLIRLLSIFLVDCYPVNLNDDASYGKINFWGVVVRIFGFERIPVL